MVACREMRVRVSFFGLLKRLAGEPDLEFHLQEGSTVRDLLLEIGRTVGERFPDEVWDAENQCFSPLVSLFVDNEEIEDLSQPLQDGSEVFLLMPVLGG